MSRENMSSAEKIKQVDIQLMPIYYGNIISTATPQKKYSVRIWPQAKGLFERDEKESIDIFVLAANMNDVAEVTACALTNRTLFIEESKKKYECGNWYDGNKYFYEILGFDKNDFPVNTETIDGEKLRMEIKQKEKEERKVRAQEAKAEKATNPPKVIKAIMYKKGLFEKERNLSELPADCELNLPKDFSKNPYQINSSSMENTVYEVDIENVSCPCADFKKRKRYLFSKNDPRRLCRHLSHIILNKLKIDQSELVTAIIAAKNNDFVKEFKFQSGISFYICKSNAEKEWVNIIARKRKPGEKDGVYTGAYEIYGYNLIEKRWSYGDGPDGASEIKKYL